MMKSVFQQMIIDFHEAIQPQGVAREISFPILPAKVKKVFTLVGMRRSGKTWFLYQQMHQLLEKDVNLKQLVYINFEDERLAELDSQHLDELLNGYYELYPQYIDERTYWFFDEIQEVQQWETFIRRLLDKEEVHIYITGSSAKMLSKEIASSLRGRAIVREVFPFNFREYLTAKNYTYQLPLTTKQRARIVHELHHFIREGGFPEVLMTEPMLHRELLQGYSDSVVYRDLIERYRIENIHGVKLLLKFCMQNAANPISVNRIYHIFKSQGIRASKDSLYDWIAYLEDAYCIFSVASFSFSTNKRVTRPKKIYPVDPGLITAFSIKHDYDWAARFETTVFIALRRHSDEIYYYQTQTGREVDFVTISPEGRLSLFQVCYDMHHYDTEKRELAALLEAMDELGLKNGTIIAQDKASTFTEQGKQIHVIPLWEFLIKNEI